MTAVRKLAAVGQRLYMLSKDCKLWMRSEYRPSWEPVSGPEGESGPLVIVDIAVTADNDPESRTYTIYVATEDGRLFYDSLWPTPWTEVELP